MQEMTRSAQPDPQCDDLDGAKPDRPLLVVNTEGLIECITTAARQLLEYRPGQYIKLPFLSHVHQKNMYRVMRDLEEMLIYERFRTAWLLRLQTGRGRWRWYQAIAERRSQRSGSGAVAIRLKAL